MDKLINLIRPDLLTFKSYSSARDEAIQGKIFLNANESPYPSIFDDGIFINRYPEKQPKELVTQLSSIYQVAENNIVLSRGSDEVIDLLTRLFCRAGQDSIMICPPTFGMYEVCAHLQGANVIEVPLIKEKNFQLDLTAILASWLPSVKIIFLCSPNNPTGNVFNTEDIFYLCDYFDNKSIIVVDEAYIEFSDTPSVSQYINRYENLVVLRTFSKAYGLAGARCGSLLAQENLVQWVKKIMAPYPLSALTAQTVLKNISSSRLTQIQQQVITVKAERTWLFNKLKEISMMKNVWPSEGNYLLVEVQDAEKIVKECAKLGIILRNMHSKLGLENCLRISIGLHEENEQLINALKNMR
jgi:histidinol-phosphate aminotransferase